MASIVNYQPAIALFFIAGWIFIILGYWARVGHLPYYIFELEDDDDFGKGLMLSGGLLNIIAIGMIIMGWQ